MKPRQRVSRVGLQLIETFEGLRTRSARLPGGAYVVGYGHTRSARQGAEVARQDAEALLIYDLMPVEAAVNEWVFAPLNQNQFDALVSFAFNVGLQSFRRSNVLRYLNRGAFLQAAAALEVWRQAEVGGETIVVDALVRRRAAEKALFLTPLEGWPHAPSAVLRPKPDFSVYMTTASNRAEEVHAPLDGETAVAHRVGSPETVPDGSEEEILDQDAVEEPEEDWSAAKAAAAAVSARLQELLPDEEEDPSDVRDEADHDGEVPQAPPSPEPSEETSTLARILAEQDVSDLDYDEVDADEEVEPFPATEDESEALPEIEDAEDLDPFPEAVSMLPDEVIARSEYAPPASQAPSHAHPSAEPSNSGPYLLLGLLGVVFWIMALVAVFRTPAEGAVGQTASSVGWILGLAGAACVLGALWFLLGREEIVPERLPEED